jgi:hypothetical protein
MSCSQYESLSLPSKTKAQARIRLKKAEEEVEVFTACLKHIEDLAQEYDAEMSKRVILVAQMKRRLRA